MPTINRLPKAPRKTENSEKRNERKKWYNNTRWRKLRIQKLQDQPLCEKCLDEEKVTAAVDVHHITSFMSTEDEETKYQLFYDYDNLMSLCKECHQKIHNPTK